MPHQAHIQIMIRHDVHYEGVFEMKFKLKNWHIFLIGFGVVIVLGSAIDPQLGGELSVPYLIWGGVGFGINYAIRNTGRIRFMIYVVVLILIGIGLWIYALNTDSSRGDYLSWAVFFTIVLAINIVYHSIKQISKKNIHPQNKPQQDFEKKESEE